MIFTYYPNKESYTPTYFLMWELPDLLTSGSTRESFKNFTEGKITKEELPIIIASGTIEAGRKTNDNVTQHSGLILLDLDRKDNPDIGEKINDINKDKLTYFSFRSPNGGYKVGVYTSIRDVQEHAAYYDAISEYYTKQYNVVCDNRCRNIARFCFLPFDENIYINPCSEKFTIKKGSPDESIPENNLKKRDNNRYTVNDPNSSGESKTEKKDINRFSTIAPNSSITDNLNKKDNSGFNENENDYNLDSLIKKGTYMGIIFNSTRYINIMCSVVPFYQDYKNQNLLDYSTRIDEAYFSGDCLTYYVFGGIPVCQVRLSREYKIKTGKRNKTLGSFCLKLIFNNPFASCERIQQEILSINEKYCEKPLTEKECIDIVKHNYDRFLRGDLDFSKAIRQNKKGISLQYVFFSQKHKKSDPKKTHKLAILAFQRGNKASKTNLISSAIESLKTGEKITINRIAEYLKVSEKMVDRNLTPELKDKYKSYTKSLRNKGL